MNLLYSIPVLSILLFQSVYGMHNARENYHNWSPLHCAVKDGRNSALVQSLLASGADVNEKTDMGWTPLHFAVSNGKIEMAKLLIEAGADVNAHDCFFTPLHFAAGNGYSSLVKLLLNSGANVNAHNETGHTPLHDAVHEGHTEVVKMLINAGAQVDAQYTKDSYINWTPLKEAALNNNAQLLEYLLYHGADVNNIDDKKLDHNKRLAVVKAKQRQRTLTYAARNSDFKSAAAFLNQGAYYNDTVKDFINTKRQELFDAIAQDNIQQVKMLLKQGFSLNTCDKYGNTLLHKAIAAGSLNSVKLLLQLLYNANAIDSYLLKKNNADKTPLDLAIECNQSTVLAWFLGLKQYPDTVSSSWCSIWNLLSATSKAFNDFVKRA